MAEESACNSDTIDLDEDDSSSESTATAEPGIKRQKLNWEEYFKFNDSSKKYKCQIKNCRSWLSEAKNPKRKSHLYRHLREVHHITEPTDNEKESGPSHGSAAGNLITMFSQMKKGSNLSFEDKLLKFIVKTNQPFTVVEQQSFRDLFPKDVKFMCANSMKSKILKTFQSRKLDLRNELQEVDGKISLIIDGWQSPNVFEFVGVVATYIDKEWRPQIRVLDFAVLEGRANAKEVAKVVCQVLDEYNIAGRIHAITLDNASVMDAMLNQLQTILSEKRPPITFWPHHQHIRCLNHVLNLSCQNALTIIKNAQPVADELEISDLSDNNACQNEQNVDELDVDDDISIENDDQNSSDDEEIEDDTTAELSPYYKIKKIVSKVRNSSTYRSEYTLMAKIIGVKPLMLIQDVTIRWNSTYLMLRRVLEMKKVVEGLVQKCPVFQKCKLSAAEWTLIEQICDLLKKFHDYTQQLSREDRPSLSLAAAVYMDLFKHLNRFKSSLGTSSTSLLKEAVDRAESKLEKYWEVSGHRAYSLGLVLDPRTKLKWYKHVGLKDQAQIARPLIEELWKSNYKVASIERNVSPEKSSSSSAQSLLRKQMTANKLSNVDELAHFLKSDTESPEVDPLDWWKSRQLEYPCLSLMAKDALGASATGTPIERKFSMGPLVISRLRSSLQPSTARAVLCLKAWFNLDK